MFRTASKLVKHGVGKLLPLFESAHGRQGQLLRNAFLSSPMMGRFYMTTVQNPPPTTLKDQLEGYLKNDQVNMDEIKRILQNMEQSRGELSHKEDTFKLFWRTIASDLPAMTQASDVISIARTALYLNINDSFLWYNVANYAHVNFGQFTTKEKVELLSLLGQQKSRQTFYNQILNTTLAPLKETLQKQLRQHDLPTLIGGAFVLTETNQKAADVISALKSMVGESTKFSETLKELQQKQPDSLAQLAYVFYIDLPFEAKSKAILNEISRLFVTAPENVLIGSLWNSVAYFCSIFASERYANHEMLTQLALVIDKKLRAKHEIDFENASIILTAFSKKIGTIGEANISPLIKQIVTATEENLASGGYEVLSQLDGRNIVNFLISLRKLLERQAIEKEKVHEFMLYFKHIITQGYLETRLQRSDYVELNKVYTQEYGKDIDRQFIELLLTRGAVQEKNPLKFPKEVYAMNESGVFEKLNEKS